ncbi:MAG: hypothetical protein GY867_08955 [bacterium]|nr:hypothetical protein [bacterium]
MRNLITTTLALCLVLAVGPLAIAADAQYGDYRITGPYTHDNLSLYFIHGRDAVQIESMLTLAEALRMEKVIVHETGRVGELSIENLSDLPIFIQSGDIVKGGRQDRILRFDYVAQPGSGKLPLPSFCVEQGRWSKRGGESHLEFKSSGNSAASKNLKLAAKIEASQQEVWDEVSNIQGHLNETVEADVRSSVSASSLQLSLENEAVKQKVRAYIEALTNAKSLSEDIVGFAFAINGELNSADVYRSRQLFDKMWPKLVEACAGEAVSLRGAEMKASPPTTRDIADWLQAADSGESSEEDVNDFTRLRIRKSDLDFTFDTFETAGKTWIHKNVIRR